MTHSRSHRILVLLLRVGGGLACTALFAIFLPTSWMAAIHRWVGLGEFPDAPITQYLARSVSAFYAVFGGLAILMSRDTVESGSSPAYDDSLRSDKWEMSVRRAADILGSHSWTCTLEAILS